MKWTGSGAGNLQLQVAETYGELSQAAAEVVFAELKKNPRLLICASAGGTPTGLYQCLAARHARQPKLFSQMRVVQIDEWAGLPPKHAATCEADLCTKLIRPLEISNNRFIPFQTNAANPVQECTRMSTWLKTNGPIDICILGLGTNGHIAMNEPGDGLAPYVHVAKLTKESQRHGMLTDLKTKPKRGFTMGIADILCARKILLLVSGAHKREVLHDVLAAQVSTCLPASLLWLHRDAIIFCDREAMGNNGPLSRPGRTQSQKNK